MVSFENQNVSQAETFNQQKKGSLFLLEKTGDASLEAEKLLKESLKIRNKGIRTLVRYFIIFYAVPTLPRLFYGKNGSKKGYKYPSLTSIKTVFQIGHNFSIDLRRADNILKKSLAMSDRWGEIIKWACMTQEIKKVGDKNGSK